MTATPIMGTQAVAQPSAAGSIMESVLIKGDLAKLSEIERVTFYNETCRSLGLNPLTRPFEYITLNSKLQLYAKRDACDQLRKLHGISLKIVSAKINSDGIYTVEVEAKTPEGREDMDVGAVSLPDTVKGELRANLILKCVTKAKRRATLSICGLGFLDETEVEDIPTAAPERQALKSSPRFEELDDEVSDAAADAPSQATGIDEQWLLRCAHLERSHGRKAWEKFYKDQTEEAQAILIKHRSEFKDWEK